MKSPTISVIVPVYNAEKTLRRCVDSILAQTFEDFELILINDGSKNQSGDICDEYAAKDSRVKTVHKTNGGVSSARNAGLRIAQGEYIAFIDSDDYIDNDYLLGFKHYDADLIISGAKLISINNNWGGTEIQTPQEYEEYHSDSFGELISRHGHNMYFRTPWSKTYRNAIIRQHSLYFDEKATLGEDTLFTLNFLSLAHNVYFFKGQGYNYTVPASLGKHILDSSKFKYCTNNILEALHKLSSNAQDTDRLEELLKTVYYIAFYNFLKSSGFFLKTKNIFFFITKRLWLLSPAKNKKEEAKRTIEVIKLLFMPKPQM